MGEMQSASARLEPTRPSILPASPKGRSGAASASTIEIAAPLKIAAGTVASRR